MAQDRFTAAAGAAEGFQRTSKGHRVLQRHDDRGKRAAGKFLAIAAVAHPRPGRIGLGRVAHRSAETAAGDLGHSPLLFQYCPFGSRPKTCCPYIVPTASQLRLTWRVTALASRQARCTGLLRCSPQPPVAAFKVSAACSASFVT